MPGRPKKFAIRYCNWEYSALGENSPLFTFSRAYCLTGENTPFFKKYIPLLSDMMAQKPSLLLRENTPFL